MPSKSLGGRHQRGACHARRPPDFARVAEVPIRCGSSPPAARTTFVIFRSSNGTGTIRFLDYWVGVRCACLTAWRKLRADGRPGPETCFQFIEQGGRCSHIRESRPRQRRTGQHLLLRLSEQSRHSRFAWTGRRHISAFAITASIAAYSISSRARRPPTTPRRTVIDMEFLAARRWSRFCRQQRALRPPRLR